MTNETTQTNQTDQQKYAIGARLKSAREALGMQEKDVAAQLRLNENVITMLENDEYPNSLPTIFIRGYIRSYGKFLDLPEYEIREALAPIQPPPNEVPKVEVRKPALPHINKAAVMKVLNIAIALTLFSLVWQWWHTHNAANPLPMSEKNIAVPFDIGAPAATQETAAAPVIIEPVRTGNPTTAQAIRVPLAPQVNNALSETASKTPVIASSPAATPITPVTPAAKHNNSGVEDEDDDVE